MFLPPPPPGKFRPPLEKKSEDAHVRIYTTRCQFYQHFMRSFYAKLLHAQIPNAQRKTDGLTVFIALLGSLSVKAALRMLMK